MKRLSFMVAALLFITVAWLGLGNRAAQAAASSEFKVNSFYAEYFLDRDEQNTSTLRIEETITAAFPDYDQSHGILRSLPQTYQNHTVGLQVQQVTDLEGQALPFTTSSQNDNLVLRIGDPNRFVRGQQVYKITYTLRNVIAMFDDHQEFYWDINGDEWPQPTGEVTAIVHIPPHLAGNLQDRLACYAGSRDTTDTGGCVIEKGAKENGGVVIPSQVTNLQANQTLTVVLGFQPDTFTQGPEVARENLWKKLYIAAAITAAVLPPLLVGNLMYRRWRAFGKDPAGKGVIVPQYQPYKGLNVLEADYILQENFRHKAVSALLIELAIRGYVVLYEIGGNHKKRDYELELVRSIASLTHVELLVLQIFFGDTPAVGDKVKLSDLKNKHHNANRKLNTYLGKALFKRGFFRADPNKDRKKYLAWGIALAVAGFLICLNRYTLPLGAGLLVSGIITLVTTHSMPSRSKEGVMAREHLLGLKAYMQLAEADRIRYLQSPKGVEKTGEKIKLFEKLLPFAMLFDIEKTWAKQFEDIYTKPPDWYHGSWSTFHTASLANAVSSFSASNSATFTSPSSSGSSGFSGGSAGGGGGGGGGGSW